MKYGKTEPAAGIEQRQQGFTLIEIMLCILIFGMGCIGIVQMQMKSIKTNSTAEALTEASFALSGYAESLLAEDIDDLTEGDTYTSTTNTGSKEITSTCEVIDAVVSGTSEVYKLVTINTSWTEGSKTKTITGYAIKIN